MNEEQVERIVRRVLIEILSPVLSVAPVTEAMTKVSPSTNKPTGNLSKDIALKLNQLGILPHLNGYRFLQEAILVVCEEGKVSGIMGHLNKRIADKFNSSPSRVERCMRHAIEVWYDMNWKKTDLFKAKPTSANFIAAISNLIKMELEE